MQTVLGLVIHRFDIHIKRETGCFDVRGEQVPGDCWSSTLFSFFYWHSTGQGGLVGGWVGSRLLGTGCTERQWVGSGDTPSLIRCNPNNLPPYFSTHQPPTYARPLRNIHKLTPIFISPQPTNIQFTPLRTVRLLPLPPLLLYVSTHRFNPCAPPLSKIQLYGSLSQKHLKDERDGREKVKCEVQCVWKWSWF